MKSKQTIKNNNNNTRTTIKKCRRRKPKQLGWRGDYKKTAATAETLVTNHPRVQTRIKTKVVRA